MSTRIETIPVKPVEVQSPCAESHEPATDLERVLSVLRNRRATRRFKGDPIPAGVLDALLDAARWAPSGYNLQSTHFVVVSNLDQRAALQAACMNQKQITQAPVSVVFTGDRRAASNNVDRIIQQERTAGTLDEKHELATRRYIGLAFNTRPMGLGWLGKALLPLVGRFMSVPSIPAVQRRYWLAKQASLAAMNFMVAAEAAGLATCPMEGFDERRVRKALGIPRHHLPILVTPVGYSGDSDTEKTRLPLDDLVHHDRWG